jgi:predicted lipoprotein
MKVSPHRKRLCLLWVVLLLVSGVLIYFFPLFRVESLSARVKQQQLASFNAPQIVNAVWDSELMARAAAAPTFETFLERFRMDPQQAIETYGKSVGVSSRRDLMLRFRGRVTLSEGAEVLSMHPTSSSETVIEIRNGPVFGNALRDSSALFDVASFTDTRKFNDLSAELNRRVETLVLPSLFAQVQEGGVLEVTGSFSVDARRPDLTSIRLIPIWFEWIER